jgi:hypothetical protein
MYRSNWSTHLDSQKLDLSANDPIRPWRLWCLIFRWYFDDDDDIITIIFHGDTDSSRGGHGTWQRMTPQTSMDVRTVIRRTALRTLVAAILRMLGAAATV